jgi:hypothetical protein
MGNLIIFVLICGYNYNVKNSKKNIAPAEYYELLLMHGIFEK